MSDSRPFEPAALLAALGVPRNRVLYVQSSADWLQRAGLHAPEMLSTLIDWVGSDGTLVMPSYPFHSTHADYLASSPVFDTRRTPARIGLLPEMFRRSPRVVRSLDPDFCVCARGAEADAIVGTAPAEPDPFGPDSSYQRMLDRGATLVGLGVSLNTNSFIHVIDSRAGRQYPVPAYEENAFATTAIDGDGLSRVVRRVCLRPQFQQLTKPSAIGVAMQPSSTVFATLDIGGARFFRWDLNPWSAWSLSHAATQAAVGHWPCWLAQLADEFPLAPPS